MFSVRFRIVLVWPVLEWMWGHVERSVLVMFQCIKLWNWKLSQWVQRDLQRHLCSVLFNIVLVWTVLEWMRGHVERSVFCMYHCGYLC